MKSLKLSITTSPEKHLKNKYSVFLFRGSTVYFSSKRNAQDFIRIFQNNTNDCLRSLNFIMSDVYKTYLDFYFHLDVLFCEKIRNAINDYNLKLAYFFKDYGQGNQSFKISSFYILFDLLKDVVFYIIDYSKSVKNYQLVNSLNSHLKVLDVLLNHFNQTIQNQELKKDYKVRVLNVVYKKPDSVAL